jgi:protein-tyrosine-phosphatase
LKQIEGHVFYLAFGYFISYLPCAVLAKVLSIGIVCGGNQSRSAMAECIARAAMATARSGHLATIASAGVVEPSAVSLDDHRCTAALIQQAAGNRLAEQFL